jgi:hypothetical protein
LFFPGIRDGLWVVRREMKPNGRGRNDSPCIAALQ